MSTITRTIGCELEVFFPDRTTFELYRNSRPERSSAITLAHDGSIRGGPNTQGLEVRTSPLSGERAESNIRKVCETLVSHGASTNKSCGLHVHVDAREIAAMRIVRFGDSDFNQNPMTRDPLGEADRLEAGPDELMFYVSHSFMRDKILTSSNAPATAMLDALMPHMGTYVQYLYAKKRSDRSEARPGENVYADYGSDGYMGKGLFLRDDKANRPQARSTTTADGKVTEEPPFVQSDWVVVFVNIERAHQALDTFWSAIRFFSIVDSTLRTLIPATRRNNSFCAPFLRVNKTGGIRPKKYSEIMEGVSGRYCGINLASLREHGTVEFRYHTGTTNANKVIHWVRLCERIVDFAITKAGRRADDVNTLEEVANEGLRRAMLFALIGLPKESAEYLEARAKAVRDADKGRAKLFIDKNRKRNAPAYEGEKSKEATTESEGIMVSQTLEEVASVHLQESQRHIRGQFSVVDALNALYADDATDTVPQSEAVTTRANPFE